MTLSDADIRASSDRYLRNAIIAVLAHDRRSTLWDAARLLSVGEEGYAYRRNVGARVRTLPEYKEISSFFTAELAAQLADSRSSTTAKLDAPVNKLARLLNSPSIKRVLLNDSLRVDFDRVIAGEEVLVVKGALGVMGAGNTSVLMQLLVGMLDASLARQQDLRAEERRVAVALKVDEAPLVLNRGFAETMALKRSAGLETVACWQTDAQWVDREVRDQLDALFAHRVYFATASTQDTRAAASLTMAAFSDTVRPGMEQLSTLGHPDVRLHLPKHHAVASWTTPAGRQAPFVAQTLPLHVDRARLALHAARQEQRGGRHLTDLSQPHWDRSQAAADGAPGSEAPTSRREPVTAAPQDAREDTMPLDRAPRGASTGAAGIPPESYRELVALDRAASMRWIKPAARPSSFDLDDVDLEILDLVAKLGHLLTSQIHRRFNPGRAATTTQRRLKRLADAGLLERFQFHRRDGGGVPMCCLVSAEGLRLLEAHARRSSVEDAPAPDSPALAGARGERVLRQARRDVHVAGWVLAIQDAVGASRCEVRGRGEAVMTPPPRSGGDGGAPLSPGDLRLPGGMAPHDFLRTDASGARLEADRFETLRPDAVVELGSAVGARESNAVAEPLDLIVELDDRPARGTAAAKLERYDHFLSGWSAHTRRYGRRREASALAVFVCRDRARARECARAADVVLRACRAYAGEYPVNWEYPGRAQVVFVAERDVHDGLMQAYGVPALPPDVRVTAAGADPVAAEASAVRKEIIPVAAPEGTGG
ncbi:MAG TPA: replication-relaxation family protein [Solirubrobacteraceae bacterium]